MWYAKATGGYSRTDPEAIANAKQAYAILRSRGWGLPAFCGFWGNVESESGYNPWRWQSDSVLYSDSPNINLQSGHAYGLVQYDPAGKYINGGTGYTGYAPNFADIPGAVSDGTAQVNFMDATAVQSGQYFPNPNYNYQISYDDYKAAVITDYSVAWLTHAWFYNFERGTWDNTRVTAAEYWYNLLKSGAGQIPIWLLFKIKERNNV